MLLTCIAIAALFWLLNKLSNQYNSTIVVAVAYVNEPTDKVVVQPLPPTLLLEVEGSGWELLRHTLDLDRPTVVVDIGSFANSGSIPLQNIRSSLSQQLPYTLEIKQVIPAVLPLQMDNSAVKVLPVKLQSAIAVHPQYGIIDAIQLNPDSVQVTGPVTLLDTMTAVPTEVLELQNVQQDQAGRLALTTNAANALSFNPQAVDYAFSVVPYTETAIAVPVNVISTDPSRVVLLNKTIQVFFQVPMTRFADTEADDFANRFRIDADFSALSTTDSTASVILSAKPDFVRQVRLDKESVKFLWVEL